ncbi:unnamed protein product [Arctogadus glacialis]
MMDHGLHPATPIRPPPSFTHQASTQLHPSGLHPASPIRPPPSFPAHPRWVELVIRMLCSARRTTDYVWIRGRSGKVRLALHHNHQTPKGLQQGAGDGGTQ